MELLVERYTSYDVSSLSDVLACFAANIEDAFITCGATPGKDYSYNDLMKLALTHLHKTELGQTFYSNTTKPSAVK